MCSFSYEFQEYFKQAPPAVTAGQGYLDYILDIMRGLRGTQKHSDAKRASMKAHGEKHKYIRQNENYALFISRRDMDFLEAQMQNVPVPEYEQALLLEEGAKLDGPSFLAYRSLTKGELDLASVKAALRSLDTCCSKPPPVNVAKNEQGSRRNFLVNNERSVDEQKAPAEEESDEMPTLRDSSSSEGQPTPAKPSSNFSDVSSQEELDFLACLAEQEVTEEDVPLHLQAFYQARTAAWQQRTEEHRKKFPKKKKRYN